MQFNGRVTQASYLYSKGEVCAETHTPRWTEVRRKREREEVRHHLLLQVRLRCSTSPPAKAPSGWVSVTLSEPSICTYVLTVEGERFCDPLQTLDEYGLLPAQKTLNIQARSARDP